MVLLDEADSLSAITYHYRDTRTEGMYDEAFKLVPKEEIFMKQVLLFNWFNTILSAFVSKAIPGDTSLKNAKNFCL